MSLSTRTNSLLLVGALLTLLPAAGCHPFAKEGESCADAPCAAGLVCFSEVCVAPSEPEPFVPECETANDCPIAGSVDGRDCVDGVCMFAECFTDAQCGSRICEDGACAEAVGCFESSECKDDQQCIDGVCRSPCEGDGDCDGAFEVCRDGECVSQCVIDLLCGGGICEDGICQDPNCNVDDDCPTNNACNGGRCESYTPCVYDEDCFDADYFCNDLQRCEERPLCTTDAECGNAALCRSNHCRPVDTCDDNTGCDDDEECLAGRCVNALDCRADADCGTGEVCLGGRCEAYTAEAVDDVVVQTAHGLCHADGTGACDVVLLVGEVATVAIGAFDASNAPTTPSPAIAIDDNVATAVPAGASATITAIAAGATTLTLSEGAVSVALDVTVIDTPTEALAVLVVDDTTGEALSGANVTAGDTSATTGADGVARFMTAPAAVDVPAVEVASVGSVGQALLDAPLTGVLRFALRPVDDVDVAAGYRIAVASTGDELGAVGLGVALGAVPHAADASLPRLFGDAFNATVDVPLLGGLPVPLPAAVSLDASLPLVGAQTVKAEAFTSTPAAPGMGLVLEGREEQQALFNLVLGGDVTDISLNLAGASEGMDAEVSVFGRVPAEALLPDGDDSDGVADVDNDGDTAELVPNYFAREPVEVRPSASPSERVGLLVEQLPSAARGAALATLGHDVTGVGYVPHGVGVVNAQSDGAQQVKVTGPSAGWSSTTRRAAVHAVFDDARFSSYAQTSVDAFGPSVDVPALLELPEGTLLLDGVPTAGARLAVLPLVDGASTYVLTFGNVAQQTTVVVPAADVGGRSVQLPASLTTLPLLSVSACHYEGMTTTAASTARFEVGSGPTRNQPLACARVVEGQ